MIFFNLKSTHGKFVLKPVKLKSNLMNIEKLSQAWCEVRKNTILFTLWYKQLFCLISVNCS